MVTRDFLLEEKPDIVIDVLDSTNLERNLYLCLQFQELGIPVVGALNMTDEAEAKGLRIDAEILSETLGIPLVKTVGTSGVGVEGLLDAILATFEATPQTRKPLKAPDYGDEIESKLHPLQEAIGADAAFSKRYPARWIAIKLLENDENAIKKLEQHANGRRVA